MEKAIIIIGLTLALVAGTLIAYDSSLAEGTLLTVVGEFDQIVVFEYKDLKPYPAIETQLTIHFRQETRIRIGLKNMGEAGYCKIIVKNGDGDKVKTLTQWLRAGQEKEITFTLDINRGILDHTEIPKLLTDYTIELYSNKKSQWYQTDEEQLLQDDFIFLLNKEVTKE